jgi:glycerophosphoryl diester phosphodiesterase
MIVYCDCVGLITVLFFPFDSDSDSYTVGLEEDIGLGFYFSFSFHTNVLTFFCFVSCIFVFFAFLLLHASGADYIEPDLVSTKDLHLVAIHSIDLSITTNVEKVFGGLTGIKNKTISKYKNKNNNGEVGYWVYDFTLEELKKLRLKQRLGSDSSDDTRRSMEFDGMFQIPTLIEILELLYDWNENIQPLWYNNNNNNNNNNVDVDVDVDGNPKQQHQQQQQQHHYYSPPPRGLYAELKDFYWLLEDANINLLDVFFDQIIGKKNNNNNQQQQEQEQAEIEDIWNNALLKNMCDTKILFEHEYRLPPLVIQSFDVDVLKNFTHRWDKIALIGENEKSVLTYEVEVDVIQPTNTNTVTANESSIVYYNIPLPTPPTILLVSHDKCNDEQNFWFNIEDNYRDYISGIGPDKRCFFKTTATTSSVTTSTEQLQYVPTIMEKSKKMNWIVHPWTERPEKQFFITPTATNDETTKNDKEVAQVQFQDPSSSSSSSPLLFRSIIDELIYMKCNIGIHGIFSESVDIAVRVMNMPCPPTTTTTTTTNVEGSGSNNNGSIATTSSSSSSCPRGGITNNDVPIGPLILFSFVSGILTALVVWKYCCTIGTTSSSSSTTAAAAAAVQQQRPQQRRNRKRRTGHSALPTTNMDDDDDDYVDYDNSIDNNNVNDDTNYNNNGNGSDSDSDSDNNDDDDDKVVVIV